MTNERRRTADTKSAPATGLRRWDALSLPVAMGLAAAVALLVRVVYMVAFRGSPFFDFLLVDARWHHEWASALARGEWSMDGRAFFRAPLYPAWLSLVYRVFGPDVLAARLVQAVLGAATAALIAGTAGRMIGRRAALVAGAIAALYGPLIFFDGELLIPNLLLALLSGALFLLAGSLTAATVSGAGLLLGLAAIARPNALALLPVVLWFVWTSTAGSKGRRAGLGAVLLVLALLPAGWVTLLNARAEGTAVFIAGQGGVNFYAGNHARASGRSVEIPELGGVEGGWAEFVGASRRVAEEARERSLNSREISDYWYGRGFDWIGNHPADAAVLTLRKAYYLVNANETPNNRDLYTARPWPLTPLLWRTPWFAFPWGLVFPLAVAGAVIGWRRNRRAAVLLIGWVLFYALSVLPFFISARFRMGLVPAMIPLAAWALAHPRALLRTGPAAAALVALVVVNTSFFDARAANPVQELTRAGSALLTQGRIPEGRALLERAAEASPASAKTAYLLAQAYDLEDRGDEAVAAARRSLERNPASPAVLAGVGAILLHHRLFVEAEVPLSRAVGMRPEDATAWVDLGRVREGLGRGEGAIEAYRHAIEANPAAERGYLELGYLYRGTGDLASAMDAWRRGAEHCPESATLWFNLALARAETGDARGALQAGERAAQLRPDDAEIRKVVAGLRNQSGKH